MSSKGRALPWYGQTQKPSRSRQRQASSASPTSSVTSTVNYGAILKANKRNPKNKVRRYAKKWLDVNLPVVLGFSDRSFRAWSKLLHPDREKNKSNTNKIARRTALMQLVSRIHQNAKRGRF